MSSILSKGKLATPPGGRPTAAVEVTPEGVLAAAVTAGGQVEYAYAPLPAGAVAPGLAEANLRAPEAVADAIRTALGQVSPRTRAVTLVLPDTAVRVLVLDFDGFPSKAAEAIPVLRFRLRKMVSFDVEHAGVSYQVLSHGKDEWRVLTAVTPGPVLAEYETAVRAAGYEPGAVLPSSMAALEMIDATEAVLTANLTPNSLTTAITSGEDLLLYRTLDLPQNEQERVDEVQRGIAVAAAYYEDRLQARAQRLHYTGMGDAAWFAQWTQETELAVVDLAQWPAGQSVPEQGRASLASVNGALALHTTAGRHGAQAGAR